MRDEWPSVPEEYSYPKAPPEHGRAGAMDRIGRRWCYHGASARAGQQRSVAGHPDQYRIHGSGRSAGTQPGTPDSEPGTISKYTVVTAAMDPPALVGMLPTRAAPMPPGTGRMKCPETQVVRR